MKIEDFKLIKNKQRPDLCWAYQYSESTPLRKFSIFTMNSGKTYFASIESKGGDGRMMTDFSKKYNSVDDSLKGFQIFLDNEN